MPNMQEEKKRKDVFRCFSEQLPTERPKSTSAIRLLAKVGSDLLEILKVWGENFHPSNSVQNLDADKISNSQTNFQTRKFPLLTTTISLQIATRIGWLYLLPLAIFTSAGTTKRVND